MKTKPMKPRRIISFTKRGTRNLSAYKKYLRTEVMPKFIVDATSAKALLQTSQVVKFEIGFGSGEFLYANAIANPDEVFIGCEPFELGALKLTDKISKAGLTNVHIFNDDALLLLQALPNNCLDTVYILFPDPWPKKRHHKRRLINHSNLTLIIQKLKPNGHLKIATDHDDYASWIISHLINRAELNWHIKTPQDVFRSFDDYVSTKYFLKAKTDPKFFFDFCR